jgi:HK97 family phage major capsid protein
VHTPGPVEPQERADHPAVPPATHSEAQATTTPTTSPEEEKMTNLLTVEERASRITEIDARLTELDATNTGAVLRFDQATEWDNLVAERAEHTTAIEAQERRTAMLANFAARAGAQEPAVPDEQRSHEPERVNLRGGAGTEGYTRGTRPTGPDIYDLNAIRQASRSLDDFTSRMRDNAYRALDVARFHGVERSAAQAQVRHVLDNVDDEHGTVARRILATGSPVYERAFGKALVAGNTLGLTNEEQRALSLGTGTAGGYAVPFQLDPTVILTNDGVDDPIRQLARVEQITGKQWQGVTSAGVTVSRSAEADEVGDNSPSFDQPTVDTSRVTGFIPFSVELDLAWPSLRSEITSLLADAKATEEATAFVTGNGTAPNPQGVLTGATTLVLAASATALAVADLTKTKNALGSRFRSRATWLATTEFFDAIRDLSTVDDGVWAELAGDINPRLLGKPTAESSGMPDFSLTASKKLAIFGDFSKFLIVDRVGMDVELVPQLFGENRRPTGQRGIVTWWFNGSKVLSANAFRVLQTAAA